MLNLGLSGISVAHERLRSWQSAEPSWVSSIKTKSHGDQAD